MNSKHIKSKFLAIKQAPPESLGQLLDQMGQVKFEPREVEEWAGRLPELQREQLRMVERLLAAALELTKRRTPEHPKGIIQIHPAAKLATGDAALTASRAADLFKRLLGPLQEELEGDLLKAYVIALRLRPKSGKAAATRRVIANQ